MSFVTQFSPTQAQTFHGVRFPHRISKCFATMLCFVLACFAAAAEGWGVEATMRQPSDAQLEIAGGKGQQSWTIRYGTAGYLEKKFVTGDGNQAWLSHGGWLRLIDISRGVVIGRWRFPGSIVHLASVGHSVQIQLEEKEGDRVFTSLTQFDPGGQQAISDWPSGNLSLNRVPFIEVESMWGTPTKVGVLSGGWRLADDQDARGMISILEEAARRDPLDPPIRIALWRVLREAKDPRAPSCLNEALSITTTDYTELLPLASLLEALDEPEASRRAFEAGYRDYLDRGNDPRLITGLIGKIILYPTQHFKPPDASTEHGRELMERHYRLGPYCEAADLAWAAYARIMDEHGRAEDARRWRVRSEEASSTSIFLLPRKLALFSDIMLLLIIASMISAPLYFVLVLIAFRHQRQADALGNPPRTWMGRVLAKSGLRHWSLTRRIALFSIVLVSWVGLGIEVGLLRGVIRVSGTPLNLTMGSLAGPRAANHLEHAIPASRERDLLVAFAHQQNGSLDEAERLYRSLPEFAESWNNLGVILRGEHHDQEATQAFEKALELNPALGEAALNLGRPTEDYWAMQYARYFPGRLMLASPRPQRIARALFGASIQQICLRGLAGPLADWKSFGAVFFVSGTGSQDAPAATIFTVLVIAIFLLALLFLFVPHRPVAEVPPRRFGVAEVLFPGLARVWSFLGGCVLVAWIYFLLQLFLILKVGTPFILTSIAEPGLTKSYNVPAAFSRSHMLDPGRAWTYLPLLLLFLLNLGLIVLSRRKEPRPESELL